MATNLRSCLRRLVFGRRTAGCWPPRRSGGAKLRSFRRLAAESLEPRTLLSSVWTALSSGCQPLVDIAFRENPGTAGDELINLSLDESGNLTYSFLVAAWAWDPACDAYRDGPPHPPITDIGHISIETSGGSDRLVLDFTHGSPVPAAGLAFNAWEDPAENDVLELIAYDVASLEVLHTGAEAGRVRLEAGPQLSFSQTEALVLGGTAADLLIDLSQTGIPGADVVVANHATPGFSAIDGATLPLTPFANPTGELTIALQASGASRADTIHIEGLDAGFDANLTISGDSDDAVNFQTNPTDLGPTSRNLIVTAGTINIAQALTVSGNVGLHAAGDIAVQASGSLTTSGSGAALLAGNDVIFGGAVHSGRGHLTVMAEDDVVQDANLVTGAAGTVSVTARGGGIAMADGTITATVHGPITYSAAGTVGLSVLRSTDGNLQVTADSDADSAGAISDATAGEDANLVTDAMVALRASSGIGTLADGDIDTAVSSLEAINQSTGDVVIQEAAGLILGGTGVQTAGPGGRIQLDVDAGELTVAATLAAGAAGEVPLAAGGPLVLEPIARVQTAGGEVRLQSDVAISMAQGSLIDAGGGDVFLASEYGVLVGRVVSPGATITIAAGQGGIADGADPADPPDPDGADLEADTAVLTAAGSIGSRAEDTPWGTVLVRLDTKLHCLDAVSDNGVGIFLINDGPLEIQRAVAGREALPLGIVDITTTSPLTVAGTVRGAVVNLTAAEGSDGVTDDDNLTLRAGTLVAAAPGTLTLGAGHEVVLEPGATATSAAGIFLDLGEAAPDPVVRWDVNGDGQVTPLDALLVINDLQQHGSRRLTALTAESLARDVNRDAYLSPLDVLHIIAHLNRPVSGQPRRT